MCRGTPATEQAGQVVDKGQATGLGGLGQQHGPLPDAPHGRHAPAELAAVHPALGGVAAQRFDGAHFGRGPHVVWVPPQHFTSKSWFLTTRTTFPWNPSWQGCTPTSSWPDSSAGTRLS